MLIVNLGWVEWKEDKTSEWTRQAEQELFSSSETKTLNSFSIQSSLRSADAMVLQLLPKQI